MGKMQTGKRKTAVATATVKKGRGVVRINGNMFDNFSPELLKLKIQEPLLLAESVVGKVDISVTSKGGGISSQAEAIRTAIAIALVEYTKDDNLKKKFKDYDRSLLVSDMRQKETSKPGGRGARKRRQKSYR